MIFSYFRRDPQRTLIAHLYKDVAQASRRPALYERLGAPDSVEGRFETLCLHVILALRALRRLPPPADDVARDLTDALFRDLDAALREAGVSDTAVPKRMKKIASAFYGRARAYDGPLEAGDAAALAEALGRNALGSDEPAPALARYALAAEEGLKALRLDDLLEQGAWPFPDPAAFDATSTQEAQP